MRSQDGARPSRPWEGRLASPAAGPWHHMLAVGSDSMVPAHPLILGTFLNLCHFNGRLEFPYLQSGNDCVLTITRDNVHELSGRQ